MIAIGALYEGSHPAPAGCWPIEANNLDSLTVHKIADEFNAHFDRLCKPAQKEFSRLQATFAFQIRITFYIGQPKLKLCEVY
jgi:hypothetical protein